MGNLPSSASSLGALTSLVSSKLTGGDGDSSSLLKDYNLGSPTAAVIGAGIAGVHVAYELSRLGFKVTVYDSRSQIADGATRHSLPFVGMGLLQPSLQHCNMRNELLWGVLPLPTCPDVVTSDHRFNSLFSAALYRWLWGRYRSCFDEDQVMTYTNNLSRLSTTVVHDLARENAALQDCILDTDVPVRQLSHSHGAPVIANSHDDDASGADSGALTPAPVARPPVLMIDPVRWTRTLAAVCQQRFGTHFALGERVEGLRSYLKYETLCTRELDVSRPDPDDPAARITTRVPYDVVVIAAGADTAPLTWNTSRLPIVGLSGLAATIHTPATEEAAKKLQPLQTLLRENAGTITDASASPALKTQPTTSFSAAKHAVSVALYGPSSLYAYTSPKAAGDAPVRQGDDAAESALHVTGLLSLDSTTGSSNGTAAAAKKQLRRLESYLRVKCNIDVPLTSAPVAAATDVTKYVRAFTPDGVPLIDHSGGSFNTFVCSGFGDHAADFAPGAAKIMAKMVELRAHDLLKEDQARADSLGIAVARTALPREQTQRVHNELQHLLTGFIPPSHIAETQKKQQQQQQSTAAAPRSTAEREGTAAQDGSANGTIFLEPTHFDNPYSTDRFGKLVKKDFALRAHKTLLERIYDQEERMVRRLEPMRHAINRRLIEVARRDDVPETFRRVVFDFFFEAEDDPAYTEVRPVLEKGMKAIAKTREPENPEKLAEMDKKSVLSREEQMRKMFIR